MHKKELILTPYSGAVPEPVAGQPRWPYNQTSDERQGILSKKLFRARVIRSGDHRWLLRISRERGSGLSCRRRRSEREHSGDGESGQHSCGHTGSKREVATHGAAKTRRRNNLALRKVVRERSSAYH